MFAFSQASDSSHKLPQTLLTTLCYKQIPCHRQFVARGSTMAVGDECVDIICAERRLLAESHAAAFSQNSFGVLPPLAFLANDNTFKLLQSASELSPHDELVELQAQQVQPHLRRSGRVLEHLPRCNLSCNLICHCCRFLVHVDIR